MEFSYPVIYDNEYVDDDGKIQIDPNIPYEDDDDLLDDDFDDLLDGPRMGVDVAYPAEIE